MMQVAIVSISGPSGSGKSTLAKALVERLGHEASVRIPADYYLVPAASRAAFLSQPLQYDWELLERTTRAPLGTAETTPTFDFETFQRISASSGRAFVVRPVRVIDSMYPCPFADLKILLSAPAATRREWVRQRDVKWESQVLERWDHLELSRTHPTSMCELYDLRLPAIRPVSDNVSEIIELLRQSKQVC